MKERPTPETDAFILSKDGFGATNYEWREHSRRLERERNKARELFESSKRARASLSEACDYLQKKLEETKRERDEAREERDILRLNSLGTIQLNIPVTTDLGYDKLADTPKTDAYQYADYILNHAGDGSQGFGGVGMTILALDPGTTETAFVLWDGRRILDADHLPNAEIRQILIGREYDLVACEMIASYGMAVGKEVFETCVWIGRFVEVARTETRLVYRRDVKLHLCHSPRAKDANVRQALIDRLGPQGTKKNPGPTYGMRSHLWAALAVGVYAHDTKE